MSEIDPRVARLAVQLATDAGLSMSEVLGLRWNDLYPNGGQPAVSAGIGHKRIVLLPPALIELARQMRDGAEASGSKDRLLFDTEPPAGHDSHRWEALRALLG